MSRLYSLTYMLVFSGWAKMPVAAQIIYPPCNNITNMQWAFNKKNESPCQVGATLEGLCFGNRWNLSTIALGQEYGGPKSPNVSNPCQCSTVTYSLISACGACQNAPFPTWTQWRKNCSDTNVTIAGFPHGIPPNTGVPAWAYINVTLPDSWDKDAALANATSSNSPETSGGASPPKSVPGTDPTGIPSPSKSKAGPIAGGVVGGVIGLAALSLVAFILYRKSYRPKQSVLRVNEKIDIGGPDSPAPMQGSMHARTSSEQLKLYNPSDPSTFPPSPFPTFTTQNAQTNPYGPLGRVAACSGASGYSGKPEV